MRTLRLVFAVAVMAVVIPVFFVSYGAYHYWRIALGCDPIP